LTNPLAHFRPHRLSLGGVFGRVAALVSRCAAAALALGVGAGSAWAQAETVANPAAAPAQPLPIDWQGPDDCDRGDAVRAKVLRLLGGSQRALSGGVKVSVMVRHEKGSRYVAVLETTTAAGGGRKRLEGESCDAIALASSVVIALSLDPNARLDAEPPAEEPKPREPPARPKPKPKPKPSSKPAPKRETFPYLHGGVGVLFELLSIPSAFTSAGVGVRHRRFSVELGGAVYQPRDVSLADRPKVGAELRLFTGELLGCFAAVPFQLGAFEVCPGLKVEYLRATAYGVSNPDEATVLMGAGVGALRGRLRAISWLSATLDAGVAVRPFQPRFVLVGVGKVFETPLVSPFARTGLVVEF
jgi:hypothetical protein